MTIDQLNKLTDEEEFINPALPSFPDVHGLKIGRAPWQLRWLQQKCPKCDGSGENCNPAINSDECTHCDGTGFRSSARPAFLAVTEREEG